MESSTYGKKVLLIRIVSTVSIGKFYWFVYFGIIMIWTSTCSKIDVIEKWQA